MGSRSTKIETGRWLRNRFTFYRGIPRRARPMEASSTTCFCWCTRLTTEHFAKTQVSLVSKYLRESTVRYMILMARFVTIFATTQIIVGAFYCREAGYLVTSGDKFLRPSLKYPSLQKHSSLAFEAFKANVGAHAHHFPLIAAARMRFAQPDYVTDLSLFCDSPNSIVCLGYRTKTIDYFLDISSASFCQGNSPSTHEENHQSHYYHRPYNPGN